MATVCVADNALQLDAIVKEYCKDSSILPKIIHQIWMNFSNNKEYNVPPAKYAKSGDSWKQNHKGFLYICWSKDLVEDFVATFFNKYRDIYNNLKYNIQRIDIVRYMFLYRYGGVYADMDIFCISNIYDKLVENGNIFFTTSPTNQGVLANSIMICKKEQKLFMYMLDHISKGLWYENVSKHITVMNSTGPLALSKIVHSYDGNVVIIPSSIYNSDDTSDKKEVDEKRVLINGCFRSWFGPESVTLSAAHSNKMFVITIVFIGFVVLCFYCILFFRSVRNKNNRKRR